ncbi:MAG: acylneuraminate cytidylyltransferase family protein [Victivallaceae bacterium]|nr:acylneuraminate cytidylyltransferase family protein [Victivallaceae bacterium]
MNNVLCTICARGGSKGVKNKNIKLLAGKPLIAYSIEQAKASGLFDHIVISTDSDAIAQIAGEYGAEVFFKRSAELASDTAAKLDVIRDAFQRSESHYENIYDYLVDLDATSPLRSVRDIKDSFKQFIKNGNDNLISATPSRRSPYFNLVELAEDGTVSLSKHLANTVVRRQDSPKCYDLNASIYIWKRDVILNAKSLFLKETGLYLMPAERSMDIDSPLDLKVVEFIMRNSKCSEIK